MLFNLEYTYFHNLCEATQNSRNNENNSADKKAILHLKKKNGVCIRDYSK